MEGWIGEGLEGLDGLEGLRADDVSKPKTVERRFDGINGESSEAPIVETTASKNQRGYVDWRSSEPSCFSPAAPFPFHVRSAAGARHG